MELGKSTDVRCRLCFCDKRCYDRQIWRCSLALGTKYGTIFDALIDTAEEIRLRRDYRFDLNEVCYKSPLAIKTSTSSPDNSLNSVSERSGLVGAPISFGWVRM
jgi:hypothetical protein